MVKDKAKKITIDEKGKKKADGVVGTTVQGNAAYGQKGKMELRSTIDICQKHEATGRSKTSSAPAGPAPKGGHFEISKPPFKHVCPQAEKKALTSSAAILREEVQRLAAANPSMVSMMQSNSLQATQQSQKRDIRGKTISQSVLAKSAAQTTAPQPKQTQPTNRPSSLQLKAGSTGSSSTSAAPAATNTPLQVLHHKSNAHSHHRSLPPPTRVSRTRAPTATMSFSITTPPTAMLVWRP
ncbi:hypothetical protein EV426DRAFT_586400 [Tirmania nivea]|nr:hypothetical protein EV426DRAFT_586400 [Tirmania nivea]